MITLTADRLFSSMTGLLLGDALGVPVEFTARETRQSDPVRGFRGYGTHNQPPGTWSDDGSLALATASVLAGATEPDLGGEHILQEAMKAFNCWFKKGDWTPDGTVFDIGITTRRALNNFNQGANPLTCGEVDEYSNGNGALMRILPVVLAVANSSYEARKNIIFNWSRITHGHYRSLLASLVYGEVLRNLMMDASPGEALAEARIRIEKEELNTGHNPLFLKEWPLFIRCTPEIKNLPPKEIRSSGYVIHTLEASLWCLLRSESFEEAVLQAVNLGDDADTTGAVTGALGATTWPRSLPPSWIQELRWTKEVRETLKGFSNRYGTPNSQLTPKGN